MIISEYPDLYDSIKEKLNEEIFYFGIMYANRRIIFKTIDNSPKKRVLHAYMSTYRRLKKLNC